MSGSIASLGGRGPHATIPGASAWTLEKSKGESFDCGVIVIRPLVNRPPSPLPPEAPRLGGRDRRHGPQKIAVVFSSGLPHRQRIILAGIAEVFMPMTTWRRGAGSTP
jgi:hypothetical protein